MNETRKIPVCEPQLYGEEIEFVTDCINTNWISSRGKYIDDFEKKFAEFVGVKNAVAACNGTVAVHLALVSAGIRSGDEVIAPTFTTVCSINPIFYCNARPVLVDSDRSWNIDVKKIEEAITGKTKAIMPVHLYGYPCEMDEIREIAKKHNLLVIEDAAEAIGSEYNGKMAGSLGDLAAFSFYANKTITTGEGGMVLTDDSEIADRARSLRDQAYGKQNKFMHHSIGYNYRMTNLQAAIGCAQIKHVNESIAARIRNAKLYSHLLKGICGVTLPPEKNNIKNTYWMYTIMIERFDRDKLMELLKNKGIDTRPVFYPIHKQPAYGDFFKGKHFQIAEELSKKGINLPSGNLLTKDDIKYVAETIVDIIG